MISHCDSLDSTSVLCSPVWASMKGCLVCTLYYDSVCASNIDVCCNSSQRSPHATCWNNRKPPQGQVHILFLRFHDVPPPMKWSILMFYLCSPTFLRSRLCLSRGVTFKIQTLGSCQLGAHARVMTSATPKTVRFDRSGA